MRHSIWAITTALLLSACTSSPSGTPPQAQSNSASSAPAVAVTCDLQEQAGQQVYTSQTHAFSIRLPQTAHVDRTTCTQDGLTAEIDGSTIAPGSTLMNASVRIALQPEPCPPVEYEQMTGSGTETISGQAFAVTHGTGVGAGNRYDSTVYQTVMRSTCYQVTTVLHSCNLGPDCGTGHTQPADLDAAAQMLNAIPRSMLLGN